MSLQKKYSQETNTFIKVCRGLATDRFVTSEGGNLALKLEDDLLMITPTRVPKQDITPEDIVFIDLDGARVEGSRKPTGETPMYLGFFKERPDIKSALHCHAPYANAFAITKSENLLMKPIFPEAVIEVGPVPIVPYAVPLSQRLADNFKPFLPKYNSLIMENHGQVIVTPQDISWAYSMVQLLEMTAMHLIHASKLGDIKELTEADLIELDGVMKTRGLILTGKPGVNKSLMDAYRQD